MRILYWTELFWPHIGGIEILSERFIPDMKARGYEFSLVTSLSPNSLKEREQYKNIDIYRFPFLASIKNNDLTLLMKIKQNLLKLKQEFKPHLVHLNFSGPSVFFHFQTEQAYKVPTIMTLHAPMPQTAHRNTLLVTSLLRSDWVASVSEFILADARRLAPEIKERSSVIYNGSKISEGQDHQQPPGKKRILCLGRLVREKGFDLAVEAFSVIRARHPDTVLTIAGDGPEKMELIKLAEDLGVRDSIEFMGWVSPAMVPGVISQATLIVIPSRWSEPFPLVALESAMLCTPVVAADVGGLSEFFLHNISGLLFEKEQVAKLAEAIIHILGDSVLAHRLGMASHTRVHECFGWDKFLDSYDALYRKLVAKVA